MKNSIMLLILGTYLVMCNGLEAQSIKVYKKSFTIEYDTIRLQPMRCSYVVLCTGKEKIQFSRKLLKLDFKKDSFPTADGRHFKNNVWDKGHYCPAESVACDSMSLIESFSYGNCAFQYYQLNKGIWLDLEKIERRLARTGRVEVEIETYFDDKPQMIGKAEIPDGFYKTLVYYPFDGGESITKSYYFANDKPKSNNLIDYELRW